MVPLIEPNSSEYFEAELSGTHCTNLLLLQGTKSSSTECASWCDITTNCIGFLFIDTDAYSHPKDCYLKHRLFIPPNTKTGHYSYYKLNTGNYAPHTPRLNFFLFINGGYIFVYFHSSLYLVWQIEYLLSQLPSRPTIGIQCMCLPFAFHLLNGTTQWIVWWPILGNCNICLLVYVSYWTHWSCDTQTIPSRPKGLEGIFLCIPLQLVK